MKRWLWLALAIAPLPFAAYASQRAADHAARRIASAIDAVAQSLGQRTAEPVAVFVEPLVDADDAAPSTEDDVASRRSAGPVARGRAPAVTQRAVAERLGVPKKGIRVRAARVLALANAGVRPSGTFVPARGRRPAGLALSGVSALGIGLRDGDVLTHAAGRPALSAGDVIGVVIGARAGRASEISGRFWRDGEPWNLIVEQPYVQRRAQPAQRAAIGPVAALR